MPIKQQPQDNAERLSLAPASALALAKEKLFSDTEHPYSCVVLKNGEYITSDAFGIKPLMVLLREDKSCFDGCAVADKIIGKAAALMLVLGKAQAVYGRIMSRSGAEILSKSNIYFEYGELVDGIKNRDKTDLCPMEKTVLDIDEPLIAFNALEETIARLMAQKAKAQR